MELSKAKKVITKDQQGNPNGYLIELFKEGYKTSVYMSVAKPKSFKGFHLHTSRKSSFICIKGIIKMTTYEHNGDNWVKKEYLMYGTDPQRLFIPTGIAIGVENIGTVDAWLINQPDPAYDPELKGEQVEYTQQELETGIVK